MDNSIVKCALPIRVIPFDLGRKLEDKDISDIKTYALNENIARDMSVKQKAILKDCIFYLIVENVSFYIFRKGITVVVIHEKQIDSFENQEYFSIEYCEDRKKAHELLFDWKHECSSIIKDVIKTLQGIVYRNSKDKHMFRESASTKFEYEGMSYVMTLSVFETEFKDANFQHFTSLFKNNIYAILDPSIIDLEDSNKFKSEIVCLDDLVRILSNLEEYYIPKDYESIEILIHI